jgi:prephenate dehydrogenase
MQIQNIYIIGLGVIGAAIAKQIKTQDKNKELKVFGFDIDDRKLINLKENNIIDDILLIEDAVRCENCYIIIALDIERTIGVLKKLNLLTFQNIIISDVCSVKEKVLHFVQHECNFIKDHFVSIHPMFGGRVVKEAKDIVAIKSETLCYIINSPLSFDYTKIIANFIRNQLKMKIGYVNQEEHDIQMARTSHLAHWLASLLFNNNIPITSEVEDLALQMKENMQLWNSILQENEKNVQVVIKKFLCLLSIEYKKEKDFATAFNLSFIKTTNYQTSPSVEKIKNTTTTFPKKLPNIFNHLIKEYQ